MERLRVKSSNIESVGYDESEKLLEVEFKSGEIYQYFGVAQSIFNGLLSAKAIGSYFASQVKDRYRFKKV